MRGILGPVTVSWTLFQVLGREWGKWNMYNQKPVIARGNTAPPHSNCGDSFLFACINWEPETGKLYLKSFVSQCTVSSEQEFEAITVYSQLMFVYFTVKFYLKCMDVAHGPYKAIEESEWHCKYLINHPPNETASTARNLVLPLSSFCHHTQI